MLDNKGFDLWAEGYDKEVGISDEENAYPFAGYKNVLNSIFQTVMQKPEPKVLDIGFGTGTLTAKLYEKGCQIYGQDFSAKMIELASVKMPEAHLFQGDFSSGLVELLLEQRYDFIIATYSLHHLDDQQKITFLHLLQDLLKDDGQILIGDVAFATREELDECRQMEGDAWDDEEIYFVAEELRKEFPDLSFTRFSYCSGVIALTR